MVTRDIILSVDNIDIDARLYLPGEDRAYPALCICHGIPSGKPKNPEDGGYPALAERFCDQGYAVLIFNFRGTGKSGGNLDLPGWTRDLKMILDYLYVQPEVDNSRLSLLGFSAGAAVAVCVAAGDPRVSSVIACSCPAEMKFADPSPVIEHFRSIGAIRDKDFPPSIEEWGKGLSNGSPVYCVDKTSPRSLLLLHGSDDETVPVTQAYKLLQKAGEPKHLIIIDNAGHQLRQNERAMSIVMDWLNTETHK